MPSKVKKAEKRMNSVYEGLRSTARQASEKRTAPTDQNALFDVLCKFFIFQSADKRRKSSDIGPTYCFFYLIIVARVRTLQAFRARNTPIEKFVGNRRELLRDSCPVDQILLAKIASYM